MYSKIFIIILFGLGVFLQGCSNTLKGVEKDLKTDWETLKKTDDWLKENMW